MPHDQAPEGNYLGCPVDAGFEKTAGGAPYFAVRLNVSHRWSNQSSQWEPLPAHEAMLKLWLTAKARPYTMDKLNRLGFGGDFNAPTFSGTSVEQGIALVCTHNERGYEEWNLQRPQGRSQGQAPDADYIRQLNAEWQNGMGSSPGAPSAPPAPAGDVDAAGGDVPF